ncbi:IclR family transcriptional regulator [Conexibacter woesei]|uniref:Transcriptional regulator, IclR family n=1 Tax=Conexibacter woesei (strain DSM 14684 / CCUG 47730 / CIP 108061 / JCM 11494 / NBRC 100937 / ID131577) TaxID=469383 RepID=D3F9Z3_CONWI|nr:IclR family transcriptional regulator [Conexibacter woesei]ADB53088.1 transcriptional regulator, IclR family [Conexibacter woesei DSM 14684]
MADSSPTPAAASAPARATGETKALVKAVAALDALLERPDGLALAELARATGLSKPTTHRLLAGLLDAGLVRSAGDGRYALGSRCLVLGAGFLAGIDLRREALPTLHELAAETGETCHLGVLSGTEVVYIEKVDSRHAIRMHSRVGATAPAVSTGLGRALLSRADADVVDAVLAAAAGPDGLLPQRTPQTITDPAALRALLAAAREEGVAIDDVQNEPGIRCVAAPILDHAGVTVAALSVSGPETRITPAEAQRLIPLVREAARTASRRLGHA